MGVIRQTGGWGGGLAFGAACLALFSANAHGKSAAEAQARQKLAQKLLKLSQSLDMKESKYPDSKGGGKDFNANDGNSFTSNTTYHSYVWDYCQQWVGNRYCERWLDAYVSGHGFGADQSPLEGVVGAEWKRLKSNDKNASGNQYAIWKVESKTGAILDVDGKLDRPNLTKFELLPEVRQKIENIGEQTAVKQMSITYDDSTGKGENTMPLPEGLRLKSGRLTKMLRNRLVANLGEIRANTRGVEFALGEDKASCQSYVQAMQKEMEEMGIEKRLQPQAILDIETNLKTLEERYDACVKLRQMSVRSVNPIVQDGKVQEGSPEDEQIDAALSRLNIAAIDNVGINVNGLPKPGFLALSKEQLSNELVDYEVGGLNARKVRMTNAEQLQSYNDNLERAATGMQEVAARAGGQVEDISGAIKKFKIQPGSGVNAVKLNDLTPEMRGELSDTGFPRTKEGDEDPADNLEDKPSELTVTRTP